jgi:hypothetical protein
MGTLRVIDLPTELICRIMAHIDVRDLYHCTLVSRIHHRSLNWSDLTTLVDVYASSSNHQRLSRVTI